jgi:hypothetical protein
MENLEIVFSFVSANSTYLAKFEASKIIFLQIFDITKKLRKKKKKKPWLWVATKKEEILMKYPKYCLKKASPPPKPK